MKSALLLLSGLAATCLSAAVPIPQPDALLPREKGTVTVVVTITSTTTRSTSTPKTNTGTVVYVTITSTVTQATTHPITTLNPEPTGPWRPGHSDRPPWWSSWLTQGNPVTVTASVGPVTIYSPIYVTVTATDPDENNFDHTVTLPVLTLGSPGDKRDEHSTDFWPHGPHRHTSWYSGGGWRTWTTDDSDQDSSTTTVYVNPPQQTTSTIYVLPPNSQRNTVTITQYVTVTPTVVQSTETPRITYYPPRNAVPEAEAEAMPQENSWSIDPIISRTVQESPTPPLPPWWHWWPTPTITSRSTSITFEPTDTPLPWIIGREAQEKREPQELGSPTRTVQVSPTPPLPPWWHWWPTSTPTAEPIIDPEVNEKRTPQVLGSPSRTVQESPTPPPFPPWWWWPPRETKALDREENEKREPQALGSPTRTVQESPTPPPFPPWWWWPPHTTETGDREVNQKRQPQELGSPSRTVQASPTPPLPPWWIWWPIPTPSGYRTVNEKREPQTLILGGGSRTVNIGPHHSRHPVTGTPYIIEATATLPMVTLGEREPQTLGFPSRTNEITPRPPHPTSVTTVYVTVTEYPYISTSKPHHHPSTLTTIVYNSPTDDVTSWTDYETLRSPTGTEIDATLTLPPFVVITPSPWDKRNPERNPDPQSLSLGWPISVTYPPTHPTGKENPCQNNIFAPPEWCYTSIRTTTVTITYTGTIIEGTATLPPWTVYEPTSWWGSGRKHKQARRQEIIGTQSRTFTYSPDPMTTVPSK